MSDELKAQDCELEYWNQQAEDYAQVQIPCEDLRAIINRAWEAPAFNSALTASEARAEAAEARVGELEEALLQHNERLRSAIAVADRNGAETNWKAFRGDLHYTAAEYHELVNSIRTLKGTPDGR